MDGHQLAAAAPQRIGDAVDVIVSRPMTANLMEYWGFAGGPPAR